MRILITGGAGFIGSNFIRYVLDIYPDDEVIVLDKLTYAGRLENLRGILHSIKFIRGDIADQSLLEEIGRVDLLFNFAAETHVDNSIRNPKPFVQTNVVGTFSLLEYSRKFDVGKFVQISTDEVYGSVIDGYFSESDPLNPSSPYSASKASADLLCRAYYRTYGLPVVITRSSNNYGPFQHPEKLIPKMVLLALHDKPLPLYGSGENVRDWLYVEDNCRAIEMVARSGSPGEIYNVGAGEEKRNIEVVRTILRVLGKSEDLIKHVKDRPGHDYRYALNAEKIRALGWEPLVSFEEGITKTVHWYLKNGWWWRPLLNTIL